MAVVTQHHTLDSSQLAETKWQREEIYADDVQRFLNTLVSSKQPPEAGSLSSTDDIDGALRSF